MVTLEIYSFWHQIMIIWLVVVSTYPIYIYGDCMVLFSWFNPVDYHTTSYLAGW